MITKARIVSALEEEDPDDLGSLVAFVDRSETELHKWSVKASYSNRAILDYVRSAAGLLLPGRRSVAEDRFARAANA